MVAALIVLLPLIAATYLIRLMYAAWTIRNREPAALLLALACRHLPPERRDWGNAMLAELPGIHGRRPRWQFTAGAIRAAITARLMSRVNTRPRLSIVTAGVGACIALTLTALFSQPDLRTNPRLPLLLLAIGVVLTGYLALGAIHATGNERTVWGAGTLAGVVLAVIWFTYTSAWWNLHGTPLIAAILLPTITAATAARSARSARAGINTVTWTALIAGIIVFVATTTDALITAGGPYDTSQISEYTNHGYTNGAPYWTGEGLANAFLLLLLIPSLTIATGTAGAVIGRCLSPRSPR
jgi:hypothetical protein